MQTKETPQIDLRYALRVGKSSRPVVAFVGGGGKSAAMFRLAGELAATGRRVVMTTTTRIFESQIALSPAWLPADALDHLDALLTAHRQVLITGGSDGRGKATGLTPAEVERLAARPDVEAVLVEADGSRMRPFKAPAAHEPVIPSSTTHLVPVVGADVLGQPLDEAHVHRADVVAALTGARLGVAVTPELVADVLAHPQGGLKGRPGTARVVPLVNKADVNPDGAAAVAHLLLQSPIIDEVIVGAVRNVDQGFHVYGRTAAVILAAGQATRFGQAKQLMPWGTTTLVGHVAQTALAAGLDPVLVVVGHEAERVAAAVAHLPVTVVPNPTYAEGQSTSLRAGVQALLERASPESPGANAALFLLADQPGVTPEIIATVQEAHRTSLAPIVVPSFQGQRGNPVLFDRALWPELLAVTGDSGGRAVFRAHREAIVTVDFDTPVVLQDIDTPEQYEALRAAGTS